MKYEILFGALAITALAYVYHRSEASLPAPDRPAAADEAPATAREPEPDTTTEREEDDESGRQHSAASCPRGVRLVEQTRHYEIDGVTAANFRRSFHQNAIDSTDYDGRAGKFGGSAASRIQYSFCMQTTARGCSIEAVSVTVNVTYTLPRWTDYDQAGSQKQAKWDRFAANLKLHERGHAEITLQSAREIEQRLMGLRHPRGCKQLKDEAQDIARAIVMDERQRQNDYDRTTRHGETQGASLPF